MSAETLIDAAKVAYVAGRIALDEFERQLDLAFAYEDVPPWTSVADVPDFAPPSWLIDEFQHAHRAAKNSGKSMVLTGGATFTPLEPFSNTAAPNGVITFP